MSSELVAPTGQKPEYLPAALLTSRAVPGRATSRPGSASAFRCSAPALTPGYLRFESETESFRELQKLLGEGTVYLIDSYDTVEGARKAARLGPPMWGVRLDSGDLGSLSKQVRAILDAAGFQDAKIMASSDLNEDRIAELLAEGAPIDSFGVGTELATSFDAPAVSAVYKIAEITNSTGKRYVAKYSSDKRTYPGAKQVFRYPERDIIGYSAECAPDVLNPARPDALLRPIIVGGSLVEPLPPYRKFASIARKRSAVSRAIIKSSTVHNCSPWLSGIEVSRAYEDRFLRRRYTVGFPLSGRCALRSRGRADR